MPITQNRMMELVTAAQDYRQALDAVINFTVAQRARVISGEATVQQAYDALILNSQANLLLRQPLKSALVIINEARHFSITHRSRNNRKAEKARKKRSISTGPNTAPQSILETPPVEPGLVAQLHTPGRVEEWEARSAQTADPLTDGAASDDLGLDMDEELPAIPEYSPKPLHPDDLAKAENFASAALAKEDYEAAYPSTESASKPKT